MTRSYPLEWWSLAPFVFDRRAATGRNRLLDAIRLSAAGSGIGIRGKLQGMRPFALDSPSKRGNGFMSRTRTNSALRHSAHLDLSAGWPVDRHRLSHSLQFTIFSLAKPDPML